MGRTTRKGAKNSRREWWHGVGQELDDAAWEPVRRGWCLGSAAFRKEMLERMEGQLGEHPPGS